jgi:cell wall-associated NlpC family hydrolase
VATLTPDALVEFTQQPPWIQKLIREALALTEKNLGYLYGSADPAQGGMDCSGTIYYALTQHGYKDVPRDSSSQFLWLRDKGTLRERGLDSTAPFDAKALRPGDLLFWTGTYAVQREVPISHVMLFLGTEKATGNPVMWGASDGRPYGGKSRYGVSVFEFRLPKAESKSRFVGFGQLPVR